MSVKTRKAVELIRDVKACFPEYFEVNVTILAIDELTVSAIDTKIDLEARFTTTPNNFRVDCMTAQMQLQDAYEKQNKAH